MNDWKNSPITRRADGSYVIAYAGFPEYHVPDNEEFHLLYEEVHAFAQEHPEKITDEPAPPEPTEEELLERAKALKLAEIERANAELDQESLGLMLDLYEAQFSPATLSENGEEQSIMEKQQRFLALRNAKRTNRNSSSEVNDCLTKEDVEAIVSVTCDSMGISAYHGIQ